MVYGAKNMINEEKWGGLHVPPQPLPLPLPQTAQRTPMVMPQHCAYIPESISSSNYVIIELSKEGQPPLLDMYAH